MSWFFSNSTATTLVAGATMLAGGVALIPAGGAALLGGLGFTASGVAGGSIAATLQSGIYGGATTGLFSLLQSAGTYVAAPAIGQTVVAAGAVVAGGVAAIMG